MSCMSGCNNDKQLLYGCDKCEKSTRGSCWHNTHVHCGAPYDSLHLNDGSLNLLDLCSVRVAHCRMEHVDLCW
jgi:hypothetical protein